jgi:hypothetical protein
MGNKVYIVEVFYSDYEGSSWIQVGIFTDKSVAESIKEKWEDFHNNNAYLLKEPDDWDPTKDEWYEDYSNHNSHHVFEWQQSREYYSLAAKFEKIGEFDYVRVEEFDLNVDGFYNQMKHISNDVFLDMIKEHDRDWKLNNILKF